MRYIIRFVLLLSLTVSSCFWAGCKGISGASEKEGIRFWTETYDSPRPLSVSFLEVDLTDERYEVIAMVADDPDGNGPAEAKLTMPVDIFKKYNAIAAVNANAFAKVSKKNKLPGWYRGCHVDIQGMAVCDGLVRSPAQVKPGSWHALWFDEKGLAHIGYARKIKNPRQAVGDWWGVLLKDGVINMPKGGSLHPRTVAGIADGGKRLIVAVVDGRQKGYSEGMSMYELADMLKKKGCTDAVNLDGGGSSIMLRSSDGLKKIETLNRPSGGLHRPVPVMLGVRKRKKSSL